MITNKSTQKDTLKYCKQKLSATQKLWRQKIESVIQDGFEVKEKNYGRFQTLQEKEEDKEEEESESEEIDTHVLCVGRATEILQMSYINR